MTYLTTIVAGSWPQNIQADYDLYHSYFPNGQRPYWLVSRWDAVGEWQTTSRQSNCLD